MNEAQLYTGIVRPLLMREPGTDLTRIENAVQVGTPDINYCVRRTEGWLELKSVAEPPKRPGTILKLPHLTRAQRLWHRRRGLSGGRTGLLLRVARPVAEYLYFQWPVVYAQLGNVPLEELRSLAVMYQPRTLHLEPFLFALMLPAPTKASVDNLPAWVDK